MKKILRGAKGAIIGGSVGLAYNFSLFFFI